MADNKLFPLLEQIYIVRFIFVISPKDNGHNQCEEDNLCLVTVNVRSKLMCNTLWKGRLPSPLKEHKGNLHPVRLSCLAIWRDLDQLWLLRTRHPQVRWTATPEKIKRLMLLGNAAEVLSISKAKGVKGLGGMRERKRNRTLKLKQSHYTPRRRLGGEEL
jgi:hypothetical protein